MEESRKKAQLSVEMARRTSELNPPSEGSKPSEAAGGCGGTGDVEGASRTRSVGDTHTHTHPGQTEVMECEAALSSPGEAGNWQNMNFTEGWTQNPRVTPSGWRPGWAPIWVLATGCV